MLNSAPLCASTTMIVISVLLLKKYLLMKEIRVIGIDLAKSRFHL